MAKQNHNLFTAIDVGSAKTIALVAEITDTIFVVVGNVGYFVNRRKRKDE